MLKDYFNNEERKDFLIAGMLLDTMEKMKNEWQERGNLSKEEGKNLKTAFTFYTKFYNNVLSRLNQNEIKALCKRQQGQEILILDDHMKRKMMGKLKEGETEIRMNIEEFLDLCEQIMDVRCRNCTSSGDKCDLYSVLDTNSISEPTGMEYKEAKCKYAYEGDTKKELSNIQKLKEAVREYQKLKNSLREALKVSENKVNELKCSKEQDLKKYTKDTIELKQQLKKAEESSILKTQEKQKAFDIKIQEHEDYKIKVEKQMEHLRIRLAEQTRIAAEEKNKARNERRKIIEVEQQIEGVLEEEFNDIRRRLGFNIENIRHNINKNTLKTNNNLKQNTRK